MSNPRGRGRPLGMPSTLARISQKSSTVRKAPGQWDLLGELAQAVSPCLTNTVQYFNKIVWVPSSYKLKLIIQGLKGA